MHLQRPADTTRTGWGGVGPRHTNVTEYEPGMENGQDELEGKDDSLKISPPSGRYTFCIVCDSEAVSKNTHGSTSSLLDFISA